MKITYDSEAEASYIYFTSIEPGGVAQTFVDLRLGVGFDSEERISSLNLFGAEDCHFQDRLQYVLQHPEAGFDEKTKSIKIAFITHSKPTKIITWEANVDLDIEGRILGLEILFAHPDYRPDDGRERLYASGALDHLSKYIVPFEELP